MVVKAARPARKRSRRSGSGGGGQYPRARVSEVQRARMLNAASHVVGELGYGGMSVARVTGRAGVSRRTFYDLFDDREDCFLELFDEAANRAGALALQAVAGQERLA